MKDKFDLVEKCLDFAKGYLNRNIKVFWPANPGMQDGKKADHINIYSETNIIAQLSRAFGNKYFNVWTEVPLEVDGVKVKGYSAIDFLAYSKKNDLLLHLEIKNNIENPGSIVTDLKRLRNLTTKKLCYHADDSHDRRHKIAKAKNKIFGIVVVLNKNEFIDWWKEPKATDHMPQGRTAQDYARIGKAIDRANARGVYDKEKIRSCCMAYALFEEEELDSLEEVLS